MPVSTVYSQPVFRAGLDAIIRTAHEQAVKGLAEYHKPLETHNGRDVYKDAMQDGVDTLMYIKQAEMEHLDLVNMVARKQHECMECEAMHKQELAERDARADKPADRGYISPLGVSLVFGEELDAMWRALENKEIADLKAAIAAIIAQNEEREAAWAALAEKVIEQNLDLNAKLKDARRGCKRLNDELRAVKSKQGLAGPQSFQTLVLPEAIAKVKQVFGPIISRAEAEASLCDANLARQANQGAGHDLITEGLLEVNLELAREDIRTLRAKLTTSEQRAAERIVLMEQQTGEIVTLKEALLATNRELTQSENRARQWRKIATGLETERDQLANDHRADMTRMSESRQRWITLFNAYQAMRVIAPLTCKDAEGIVALWDKIPAEDKELAARHPEKAGAQEFLDAGAYAEAVRDIYEHGELSA